jgi:invasion protein IalB
MTRTLLTLAATLGLAMAAPAAAQTTTEAPPEAPPAETPAAGTTPDGLSMGTPAEDGIGSTYVAATHGAWEQRCVRTEDGSDPCQLYQLMKDDTGNPVAEISLFGLPAGGPAVAGATIIVPLETLLTENLTLQVDAGAVKKYPFTWCAPVGCIARVGFTGEELAALQKGANAALTIVPVVAPDQKVTVRASLKGFTAGYDAVNAANADNPNPPAAAGGN